MRCPKCGHERRMGETAPEWQCPSCGVAYAKASAAGREDPPARRRARTGGGWLGKLVLVIIAAAVMWAVVPGTRPVPVRQAGLANANIVMYSLTTCGYCRARRAELHAKGIPFVEYFIDTDRPRQEELFEKLMKAGYRGGGIGTPTFEVNGKMLPNNPSLDSILQAAL